jgi:hypothetical protein
MPRSYNGVGAAAEPGLNKATDYFQNPVPKPALTCILQQIAANHK